MTFRVTHITGILFWLTVWLGASGCSSVERVAEQPEVDLQETVESKWSDVETVDVSAYPDAQNATREPVVHSAPKLLLDSAADDGVVTEVDGFRIHIFASAERSEAVQVEEALRRWLESLSDQRRSVLGIKEDPEIYSFYKQPYYRVRLGDFTSRRAAGPLLSALKPSFNAALIVPDVILVVR